MASVLTAPAAPRAAAATSAGASRAVIVSVLAVLVVIAVAIGAMVLDGKTYEASPEQARADIVAEP